MLSPSPHPHLGSISTIVQNSYKGLRWLKDSKLGGGYVHAQFTSMTPHKPFHAGKTSLQLALALVTSLFLMQSLEFTCLYFPATLMR